MKRIIIQLLFLLMLFNNNMQANLFLEEDKQVHMAIGALIYGSCLVVFDEELLCIMPVIAAAFFKEGYD